MGHFLGDRGSIKRQGHATRQGPHNIILQKNTKKNRKSVERKYHLFVYVPLTACSLTTFEVD